MSLSYLLFDTCVWLSLAQDPDAVPMLDALSAHIKSGTVLLVVPGVVIDEFGRNRERILEQHRERLTTYVKHARALSRLLGPEHADLLRRALEAADEQIRLRTDSLADALNRVAKLLMHERSIRVHPSPQHSERVIERALLKKAPFHRNKNGVADALHMEHFRDLIAAEGFVHKAVFVTENTSDYSDIKDRSSVHSDYAEVFTAENVSFSVNVARIIEALGPFQESARAIERHSGPSQLTSDACAAGGNHLLSGHDGVYRRSALGGLTWQVLCSKCGAWLDTGEHWD